MIDDPLVKTLLTNVVEDESNLPIIQSLIDGIETDEEIAKKTGIKLNIVRKILYRLYDMGLVIKEVKTLKLNGLHILGNLKLKKLFHVLEKILKNI